MKNGNLKYVYGPVQSWGMGKSLGIDPLSDRVKICNLDCIYCQLGKTRELTAERRDYVPASVIAEEIARFFDAAPRRDPAIADNIDFLTFSGRGEPTLAGNLGEMIRAVRHIRKEKIAVITNSTLLHLSEVRRDLNQSDLVVAKLDACDERSFQSVDKAMHGTTFSTTLAGIRQFRKDFRGRLAIRIMFVEENRSCARPIADLVREINADEIQLNTPLRPSAARPLDEEGMREIKSCFAGMPAVTVYEADRKETVPFDVGETVKRHGNFRKKAGRK